MGNVQVLNELSSHSVNLVNADSENNSFGTFVRRVLEKVNNPKLDNNPICDGKDCQLRGE